MKENNMNRTELAKKLNVSKGYINQILNGDSDHRISKLVELSLAIGFVPKIVFEDIEKHIRKESSHSINIYKYRSNYLNHNDLLLTASSNEDLKVKKYSSKKEKV
ncbi:MAG: helix-turn-helix transcriptional regulator [Paludibacteraceae bacterium]|nr:helix-turn-helix transcriptional regulator [Paludibacteraceae bacterium]